VLEPHPEEVPLLVGDDTGVLTPAEIEELARK
jgi:hypothetical protein